MFVNCFYKTYFGNVLFPKGTSCRLLCFSTNFLQQLFVFEIQESKKLEGTPSHCEETK